MFCQIDGTFRCSVLNEDKLMNTVYKVRLTYHFTLKSTPDGQFSPGSKSKNVTDIFLRDETLHHIVDKQ